MRSLDRLFLYYFISHLFFAVTVDLVPLYELLGLYGPLSQFRLYYVRTFEDPLMAKNHIFFQAFLLCELFLQVPFFVYAIKTILAGKFKHMGILIKVIY